MASKQVKTPGERFAERLRALREERGVSQYRLAQLTGVSKQAVSQLEQGGDPAWSTIQKFALALGVDVNAFLDPGITLPEIKPAALGRPKKGAKM